MSQDLANRLRRIFPKGIKGVIFDCDGVIVDSKAVNISYFNMLLKELGYPEMTEESRDYVQMVSGSEAIDFLIPKKDHNKLPEIFKRKPYYKEALPQLVLEPGLLELLQCLRDKGAHIGVHTNRRGTDLKEILEYLGIAKFFTVRMHVDIVPAKPHPGGTLKILEEWKLEPSMAAFIGDSLTDEGVTRTLGMPLISYRNKELNAEIFIENFIDLRQALSKTYDD